MFEQTSVWLGTGYRPRYKLFSVTIIIVKPMGGGLGDQFGQSGLRSPTDISVVRDVTCYCRGCFWTTKGEGKGRGEGKVIWTWIFNRYQCGQRLN